MDLFYSNYKANDKYVVMNEIDSKHIIRSFRKNIGDSIMITNGLGYLCNAKIVEIGKKIKVKINSIEKFKSSSNSIHIALSPLKNASRFEWFVEKSTELGISQITPLVCEYSEKKKVNMDRLERILISSLKQSNQFFKPNRGYSLSGGAGYILESHTTSFTLQAAYCTLRTTNARY